MAKSKRTYEVNGNSYYKKYSNIKKESEYDDDN